MKTIFKILYIVLIINSMGYSQQFGTGALLDQTKFDSAIKAPPSTRGDLFSIPRNYSLKKYAPIPGDQGKTATCTGWAISYEARTILAAINNDWDSLQINNNKFSPSYVYNQIRPRDGCTNGTSLVDGLNLLKNDGVLPFQDFGYDCERKVENKDKIKASNYRIREYREILNRNSKNKIINVKKSISQNKPVVIGINCPQSFYSAKDVWNPEKNEYNKNVNGHAVTVVGFDDEKEGGAFEIINSWGVNWGDSGFTWIKYDDFDHFCVWAAELIGNRNTTDYKLNANVFLKKVNGRKVNLVINGNVFSTVDSFYSGDKFQLYVKNKEPAYLYIYSIDKQKGIIPLFPNDSLISEFLAYSVNNLIIPSENLAFELDDNVGMSSLLLVFSTSKINDKLNKILLNDYSEISNDFTKILLDKMPVQQIYNNKLNSENVIIISDSLKSNWITTVKIDIKHLPNGNN